MAKDKLRSPIGIIGVLTIVTFCSIRWGNILVCGMQSERGQSIDKKNLVCYKVAQFRGIKGRRLLENRYYGLPWGGKMVPVGEARGIGG